MSSKTTKAGRRASFRSHLTGHAVRRHRRWVRGELRAAGATVTRLYGVGNYLVGVGTGVGGAWVLPRNAKAELVDGIGALAVTTDT